MGRISIKAIRGIVEASVQASLDIDLVLSAAGIERSSLDSVDNYVTYNQLCTFWQELARSSGRADIGLYLADFAHEGTFDFLGYIMRSSANQGEAWTRMIRYSHLLNQCSEYALETQGQSVQITYNFPTIHLPPPPENSQWILANILLRSQSMIGKTWTPISVGFRHPMPKELTAYQQTFCCPLKFHQPVNYIQADIELLQAPMLKAEPGLCAVLERYGEELLQRFPPSSNFVDEVRRAIIEGLQQGEVGAEQISTRLSVTSRTLQRNLKEATTSFSALLDKTRRELSVYYLQNSDLSISEIAFLLGFAETSTFDRAFKRWHHISPREFRGSVPQAKAQNMADD